ncbi:hypothetical protein ACRRTK_010333 [Alexandromys fortis]
MPYDESLCHIRVGGPLRGQRSLVRKSYIFWTYILERDIGTLAPSFSLLRCLEVSSSLLPGASTMVFCATRSPKAIVPSSLGLTPLKHKPTQPSFRSSQGFRQSEESWFTH